MLAHFMCPCGCGKTLDTKFVNYMFEIDIVMRRKGYKGIKMTSGPRCEKYNEKIGGAKNSAHIRGIAIDLAFEDSKELYYLLKAALSANFKRVGINFNKKFIHVDLGEEKDGYKQDIVFNY